MKTIKNFAINFNSFNGRTTFASGDLLTGQLSFELTKETKISYIMVVAVGKAEVHWSSSSGSGKRRRRTSHSAAVEFFKLKSTIMEVDGAATGSTKLPPGTHVYPLSCQLPQGDFPSSFKGIHGKIMYTLKAEIKRPWHLSDDFVTEFNFVNHLNTNMPELWYPLSGSNNMTVCCLWCASGPISLTASTERKAFTPGDTVRIFCDINNGSSRTVTPKMKLQQKQFFFTVSRDLGPRRMVVKNLASVTADPIVGPSSDIHSEFLVPIPRDAEPTISNCRILEVENIIEVNLDVSGSSKVTVLFPIILFIPPVNIQPQNHFALIVSVKCSYFAIKRRKLEKRDILKEVGDPIPPSTSHTATKVITIPATTAGSVLNCNILKVEYRLSVYLDVKFASDPEIKFPIIILSKLLHSEEEQKTDGLDSVMTSPV
ncbi:arrestin domain-containing protein 3-like [Nelusetta ayraudi]|uniref:arrestin domain-containing protein 3-like n=1 Tax=Nelusetta ayraudi TaxID=303726 RepID=UPI003F6EFAD3